MATVTEGLRQLLDPIDALLLSVLDGDVEAARAALPEGDPLWEPWLHKVASLWSCEEGSEDAFVYASQELIANSARAGVDSSVVGTVAAAIEWRHQRNPKLLLNKSGLPIGEQTAAWLTTLERRKVRALWPSQCGAISAGLLRERVFVAKLPTGSGKTRLIELVAAQALDSGPGSTVIVVAPTRALVRQLEEELRSSLPQAKVVGLLGGYDDDVTDPKDPPTGSVVVMTPERLDLIRRRAAAPSPSRSFLAKVSAVVADEAHLLSDPKRGARFELTLGRLAARTDLRLVLLSSQFNDVENLARWMDEKESGAFETTWRAAPLLYGAYFREDGIGYFQRDVDREATPIARLWENAKERKILEKEASLLPILKAELKFEVAFLAKEESSHGTVVVYSDRANLVESRALCVAEALGAASPSAELEAAASDIRGLNTKAAELLLRGVGVHAAYLPKQALSLVEQLARKSELRALVCTSTLAQGIDFPVASVLIGWRSHIEGAYSASTLRNLAGRAGRGGRYFAGRVVVAQTTRAAAQELLRVIREELPPSRSAASTVVDLLLQESPQNQDAVDELVLFLTEDAVDNAEWGEVIEEALGRSLWWFSATTALRQAAVGRLGAHCSILRQRYPDQKMRAALHQSGLPVSSSTIVLNALYEQPEIGQAILAGDLPTLLQVCLLVPELATELHKRGLPASDVPGAVTSWVRGDSRDVVSTHLAVSSSIAQLEILCDGPLPWIAGAVYSIARVLVDGQPGGPPEGAYKALDHQLIRYGVPTSEMAQLVRRGNDREDVLEATNRYLSDEAYWEALLESGPPDEV